MPFLRAVDVVHGRDWHPGSWRARFSSFNPVTRKWKAKIWRHSCGKACIWMTPPCGLSSPHHDVKKKNAIALTWRHSGSMTCMSIITLTWWMTRILNRYRPFRSWGLGCSDRAVNMSINPAHPIPFRIEKKCHPPTAEFKVEDPLPHFFIFWQCIVPPLASSNRCQETA